MKLFLGVVVLIGIMLAIFGIVGTAALLLVGYFALKIFDAAVISR